MKKKIKLTILGAGSTGMATAAYFSIGGCDVTLCDEAEQSADFDVIRRQGGILLRGASGRTGCAMPARLTCDFQEALEDADRILVCTSAARHKQIADRIAPLARPGQIFLLSPGNFGSFLFRQALQEQGKQETVVAELCGNLWACRRTAPAEVLIAMPMKEGVVSALPAKNTARVIAAFRDILPLREGKNVLEVSMNSPNVISHVAGAVMNATQIERAGEQFAFFRDGLGESVIQSFVGLEQERNAVMEKLGLSVYGASSETLMRTLMQPDCPKALRYFKTLDGPSGFSHRYVSEDASCGVAMIVSLGREYHIPTPLTEAFLAIAQWINHTDYVQNGCSLKNIGLSDLTVEQLMARL